MTNANTKIKASKMFIEMVNLIYSQESTLINSQIDKYNKVIRKLKNRKKITERESDILEILLEIVV